MSYLLIFSIFIAFPFLALGWEIAQFRLKDEQETRAKALERCIFEPSKNDIIHTYYDKYVINFNQTLNQANYAYYISTNGGQNCNNKKFHNDPYGINKLTTSDYTNSGFDRGHLVPNADYGCSTYIISNVVPMNSNLNSGVWAQNEKRIRNKYPNKLVYVGCDYDINKFYNSKNNNKLYIPIGCYYVVLNIDTLPKPHEQIQLLTTGVGTNIKNEDILDYGYYLNKKKSVKEKKMPKWITSCKIIKKSFLNILMRFILGIGILFIIIYL